MASRMTVKADIHTTYVDALTLWIALSGEWGYDNVRIVTANAFTSILLGLYVCTRVYVYIICIYSLQNICLEIEVIAFNLLCIA